MRLEGSIYGMQHLQSGLCEFVFREVARRQKNLWLGATRQSQMSKYSTSPIVMQLEEWEMPLDEKTRRRLTGVQTVSDLLEHFLLKGVRLDSHMGFWGLVSGRYPLILRTDVPQPITMLQRQCRGERYVTYLNTKEDLNRPIGRFSGSFEFLMHDLEHAHKFFGDEEMFRGQVKFFNLLKAILPRMQKWLVDPLFEKDLNYLMSDMNSHPVHLFKYLKAIVLTAELRRGNEDHAGLDAFWIEVLAEWRTPEDIREAALRINRPGLETGADQNLVHEFFKGAILQ
jgi:hypothetical protein